MRKIIFLIAFSLGVNVLWGQPSDKPDQDTTFINIIQEGYTAMDTRDLKALAIRIEEAETYVAQTPSVPAEQKIKIFYLRARLYTHRGQFKPALKEAEQLLKQIDEDPEKYRTSIPLSNVWNLFGILYYATGELDSALYSYQKALVYNQVDSEESQLKSIPNIESNIGAIYAKKREDNEALKHYLVSLEWRRKQKDIDSINLAGTLRNIGNAYKAKGDYEKSLFYLDESLKINEKILPNNSYRLAPLYLDLGRAYASIGQLEKANRHYEKTHAIIAGTDVERTMEKSIYIRLRLDQALYYIAKREFDIVEKLLQEALVYSKRVMGENHDYTVSTYNDLGNSFLMQGKYVAADSCFLNALKSANGNPAISHKYRAGALQGLGFVYYYQENLKPALDLFEMADSIYTIAYGPFSFSRGNMLNMKGRIWEKMGDCMEANKSFYKAIDVFYQSELEDISQLAETPCLYPTRAANIILNYAIHLQTCFMDYQDSLEKARVVLDEYNVMLTRFRNENPYESDFTSLLDISEYIEHSVLDNLFLRYPSSPLPEKELKTAFESIEQNTHISLTRSVNSQSNEMFSTLSAPVLALERSIKVELAYLDKSLEDQQQKEIPDSLRITHLREQLFTFQNRSDSLQKVIKDDYPNYYQLKYDPSVVQIKDLQKKLPTHTMLLRYILGESQNYLFVIDKKSFQLITLPVFERGLIDTLRNAITHPNLRTSLDSHSPAYHDSLFRYTAYKLYQHLIAPISKKINKPLPERLIIIPSGELSYLPFSSLLTEPTSKADLPKNYPYLLKKYAISYAFSATSYERQIERKSFRKKGLLAFAPAFDGQIFDESSLVSARTRGHLLPLGYNQKEVEQIGELMQ
ncbi:MAG: tetratricopeptide repeat protein, partial [Bacteroidetes bacterium]|nr:tetratricopeptide repeat protein [Bacteroidota bacterium]